MPLIDLNGLGHFKDRENAMIAAEYSASKTYKVGQHAYYKGTLYSCKTAITTAEAWTAAHWETVPLADEVTSQSEKIIAVSNRTNVLHNLVDYGYVDEDIIGDPSASAVVSRVSVYRKNTQVKINAPSMSSNVRVKVSGSLAISASNTATDAWTTGISLTSGHKYRATLAKLSGTVTGNDLLIAVYNVGTHSSIGDASTSDNCSMRTFTATDTKINLVIYIYSGTVVSNAVYQVILEDITDESLLVPEGTAWD